MSKKNISVILLLVVMNCLCPPVVIKQECDHPSDLPMCEGLSTYSIIDTTEFPPYMSSVGRLVFYIPSGSSNPFPVILVEPGFFSQSTDLEDVEKRYASHGFLVVGVNNTSHYDTITTSLDSYKMALLQTVRYIIESSKDNTHFLFGLADTTAIGISGHSMGGGGAIQACDSIGKVNGQSIRAAVFMNPYGKCDGQHIQVPSLLLASENDMAVSPFMPMGASTPENIYFSYQSIPGSTVKSFGILKGMDHNAVVDENPLLATSGNASMFLPTMVSWFKVFLAGDLSYKKYIDSTTTEFLDLKERFTAKGSVPGYVYEGL